MPSRKQISRISRRAVAAAGVASALAVAAPVAGASAQVPAFPGFGGVGGLPAWGGGLGAFTPAPLAFVGPAVAIGPTVIGSVFNGGTTVVVSSGTAVGATNASP